MDARITTETDGIDLEKYYDDEAFNLPSIVYEFSNRTDEDVVVRLDETVPPALAPDELGFHGDFGRDHWDLDGRALEFERRLGAGETCKTVIGIRLSDPPAPEEIIERPASLERGNAAEAPATSPTGTQEGQTLEAAVASDEGGAGGPALESMTIPEPAENGATSDERQSTAAGETAEDDSVITALVDELQSEEVANSDLEYLEERFGSAPSQSNSVDARIKQLQQELADLRAYKSSLEGFLDEHGSADDVVERFETRLDDLERRVSTIEGTLDTHESEIGANEAGIRDNEAGISNNEAAIDRLETTLDEREGELQAVAENVASLEADFPAPDLEERVTELDEELGEIRSLQQKLKRVFAGNGDDG